MSGGKPHLAIVKSKYRPEIIDGLYRGAVAVLDEAGASHEAVEVSGSLESPESGTASCGCNHRQCQPGEIHGVDLRDGNVRKRTRTAKETLAS